MKPVNLMKLVDQGGCSAKIPPAQLQAALSHFQPLINDNVLVGFDTHDDAGVYKLNDEQALVFTVDFFPPLCADPFDYGQISATNALSDIYAMGGQPVMATNIVTFPADFDLSILNEILAGGQKAAAEAGCVVIGGHTIADKTPKYGMSVVGLIHPDKILTNCGAQTGDILILTKPIGSGILLSAFKNDLITEKELEQALKSMKTLNKTASEILCSFNAHAATDITGFGLLGHALKMAMASDVSFELDSQAIPLFDQVSRLANEGCLPTAIFNNKEFIEPHLKSDVDFFTTLSMMDAQSSGGLFVSLSQDEGAKALQALHENGISEAAIVGKVLEKDEYLIYLK